jgi:choline dehydrogenase-like flavoprotein
MTPMADSDDSKDSDRSDDSDHYDVVIVGGGPTGCAVGVFAARYGLDAVIFDRGNSSIRRCAYLENYLGFPRGIDIETFYALLHDHVREAGCELVSEMVVSVEDDDGFVVETQEDSHFTAERVVAATRYGGDYLRPLDDGTMFETYEYGGEEQERFNRSYTEAAGETAVDGLYVAAPSEEADHQALMAAGRGARVGLALIEEIRQERGYPESIANQYDWVRRKAEITDEWSDRDRWREWFADHLPDDHELDEEQRVELREHEIDRSFDAYLSREAIESRIPRGQARLLEHMDDDLILEATREITAERRSEGNE